MVIAPEGQVGRLEAFVPVGIGGEVLGFLPSSARCPRQWFHYLPCIPLLWLAPSLVRFLSIFPEYRQVGSKTI